MPIADLFILMTLLFIGFLLALSSIYKRAHARNKQARIDLWLVSTTHLCDLVHALQSTASQSAEFGRYQSLLQAAHLIGQSVFRMMAGPQSLKGDSAMFSENVICEGYGTELRGLDLGVLNHSRDELLQAPSLAAALGLMGTLMQSVMAQRAHTLTPG